jgi:carbon storage regulator
MLVMSRRQGETILIGGEIEIVIAHIGRSRVKVGIRAPRQMPVIAREMKLVSEENLAAAGATQEALTGLLEWNRARKQPGVPCSPAPTAPSGDRGF